MKKLLLFLVVLLLVGCETKPNEETTLTLEEQLIVLLGENTNRQDNEGNTIERIQGVEYSSDYVLIKIGGNHDILGIHNTLIGMHKDIINVMKEIKFDVDQVRFEIYYNIFDDNNNVTETKVLTCTVLTDSDIVWNTDNHENIPTITDNYWKREGL